jgi:hypothetical protein
VLLADVESLNPIPRVSDRSVFAARVFVCRLTGGLDALAACFVLVVRFGRVDVCADVSFLATGMVMDACFINLFDDNKMDNSV